MSDTLVNSFYEGVPSQITTTGPDVLSYRQQLDDLTQFCDPEPKSLINEPDYKPAPGAKASRFHYAEDVRYCPQRKAIVFNIVRPDTQYSKGSTIKGVTIPVYKLAELGFGAPGQWRYINPILNEVEFGHLEETPESRDPFEGV
jgi:hypothetical protein